MNTLRRPLATPLFLLYVVGVVLLAWQPLRTMIQPSYEGILYKGGDESQYIMRVTDAIDAPFTDVSNAITTGTPGLQMTLLESTAGTLLGWTGLSGPILTILLSVLLAPLLIPLFTLLAIRFHVPRPMAIAGGALLFFLLIGPLRRVVHQSWSLPFVLLALFLIVDWWQHPTRVRSLILGIVLGLMPGVYIWAWTYTWAVFGFVIVFTIIADVRRQHFRATTVHIVQALIAGIIALVVASPFLFLMWVNAHHPDSAETSIRSSLIHAREFESLSRSGVLVLFAALAAFTIGQQSERRKLLPLLAMIFGLVAVLHQQFVHGLVLSFWTHYYPYVCTVSLLFILVLLASRQRSSIANLAMFSAAVFLVAALGDYHGRAAVFTTMPHWEKYQHLAPGLASLNQMNEKKIVLSDLDSSLIIGTYTNHDLVYAEYLRHVLMSFPELAQRYCLTQLITGKPADAAWLANNVKELSAAGQTATNAKQERDTKLTQEACDAVYAEPKKFLTAFGTTHVLWDEKNYPDWKIPATLFTEIEKGAGWSLWQAK